jgi:hypothetical protein
MSKTPNLCTNRCAVQGVGDWIMKINEIFDFKERLCVIDYLYADF